MKSGRDSNIPNQPLVNGTLHNALQQSAATARKGLQADLVPIAEPVSMQVVATQYGDLQNDRVGDTGLERGAKLPGKTVVLEIGGAESGAVDAVNDTLDADLAVVVEAWLGLSEAVRASILRLAVGAGD